MAHQRKPGGMVSKWKTTQGQRRVKVSVGNVHTLGQAGWEDFIICPLGSVCVMCALITVGR